MTTFTSEDREMAAKHTHPEKITDEEILQVMINVYSDTVPPIRGVEFARAILRKAQEVNPI
ncbi:hypothetical protein [Polynucleobacter sp. AP-Nino-20-G2]|uniref:hypothetical protein n=1 Tax=Polynucleobacter sp. AP-Nino-20-G2 TaxID=2576917 RepID=UPI001BFD6453|nr:hypothetical protein [Polynucleobacter sp. AP-Nino-20-G2]QWE17281.1 hypothetical protein FD960_03450 [Polynucleobacter sp. AP-Nino-20-G2]